MGAEASSEKASNVQSGLALLAATRLTSPSISWAMASLLTRRRLGVRVVGIGLVGFVMADDATGRCAELAVSCHVASGAADDGALDAASTPGAEAIAIAAAKTAANIHFMTALPILETAESIRSGEGRSGLQRSKATGLGLPMIVSSTAPADQRN